MPLTLTWTGADRFPVEGEGLRPEAVAGATAAEVARRPILVGNRDAEIGEVFRVEGDGSDGHLVVAGDLRHVRRLGAGMASGTLTVRGDVGPLLGAGMGGGAIEVDGSAGAWAGAEMRGGLVRIRGDAGDDLGAALPGSRTGMRDGIILVGGSIGEGAAVAMRRGLIAVAGRAGAGLARWMIAGSVFAFGPVDDFPGAGMKRGTIALFRADAPSLLPTFRYACRHRPPFVTVYLRALRDRGFPVPEAAFAGAFERYNGDLIDGGQGEILVWRSD